LIGAFLLLLIPARSVSIIVSTAMIAVAIFSVVYRKSGLQDAEGRPSAAGESSGNALTFLLGIYGGFFNDGYVTILSSLPITYFIFRPEENRIFSSELRAPISFDR
jgi:uncharacterized membrane protein YfcA